MHQANLVHLPRVYTAALAASGRQAIAEQVAERVMLADAGDDATSLVERAVLLALRTRPHDAFEPMGTEEREVVALARLAGASTGRAATVLGIDVAEVRARMSRGLRALARVSAGDERRTPPPRPGSGSAASPGRGARAS